MIAEKDYRGQQLGRAATCTMMLYGATQLGVIRFFCKINDNNIPSIHMFQSIGFVQCGYAECFKQVELEFNVNNIPRLEELKAICEKYGGTYRTVPCPLLRTDGD